MMRAQKNNSFPFLQDDFIAAPPSYALTHQILNWFIWLALPVDPATAAGCSAHQTRW